MSSAAIEAQNILGVPLRLHQGSYPVHLHVQRVASNCSGHHKLCVCVGAHSLPAFYLHLAPSPSCMFKRIRTFWKACSRSVSRFSLASVHRHLGSEHHPPVDKHSRSSASASHICCSGQCSPPAISLLQVWVSLVQRRVHSAPPDAC